MIVNPSFPDIALSVVVVALGAFAGGLLRGVLRAVGGRYVGTTLSNLAACFALGVLFGRSELGVNNIWWEVSFGIGFCGALSTLAALAEELGHLYHARRWTVLLGYIALSVLGGVFALAFGDFFGRIEFPWLQYIS